MTIILYDVCSSPPGQALSTNVWKTRYCLNYKRLVHRTEWIEAPDLKAFYLAHNIIPSKKRDGSPLYSVPLIYDPKTKKYVTESFAIAEYLDETYPEYPILPSGTRPLQAPFEISVQNNIFSALQAFWEIEMDRLSPPTAAFFRPISRAIYWSDKVIPLEDQWADFERGLGRMAEWYNKSEGQFLLGRTVSWADIVVSCYLVWFRIILGEDSSEWRDIMTWNDGIWASLMEGMRAYEKIF